MPFAARSARALVPFVSTSATRTCSVEMNAIAQLLREPIRGVKRLAQLARHRRCRAASLRWKAIHLLFDRGREIARIEPGLLEHRGDDAFFLPEECEQQVRIIDDRIAPCARQRGGIL